MSHALPALVLGICSIIGLVLVPLGLPGLWVMVAGVAGYGAAFWVAGGCALVTAVVAAGTRTTGGLTGS